MTRSWCDWRWQLKLGGWVACVGVVVGGGDRAYAQVTADPSLGTTVTVNGDTFEITNGTTIGDKNLFHSFSNFSIPNGGTAHFINAPTITNVLARVTGGSPSDIQGLIRAQGSANLFLMNPNGILFGPNAQLDLGGSFVATTANAIQFPGGAEFAQNSPVSADNSLLSVNPSAFLFNKIAAQPITNQSLLGLLVPDGQGLLLLGGNVSLEGGRLFAPGGRVELGGVAGVGAVALNTDGNNLRLSFPDDVARADVSLVNGAKAAVFGNGGNIKINARNLYILQGSVLSAGIIDNFGLSSDQAGDITLDATETIIVGQSSEVGNFSLSNTIGNNGNININARSLSLTDGASLITSTGGRGNAGSVFIQTDDSVSLTGSNTNISSNIGSGAIGDGGDINIAAKSLSISDGAQLQAGILGATNTLPGGRGTAGNINIYVSDTTTIGGTDSDGLPSAVINDLVPGAVGQGGNINISTGSLSITNGAGLLTRTAGEGNAGSVLVQADSLSINDARIDTRTFGKGNAGNLSLQVDDSISLVNSIIFGDVNPMAVGQGGDIHIQAGSLSLNNTRLLTRTAGEGNAGSVLVQAESLSINDARIETRTSGKGNAGSIALQANDSISLANSLIYSDVISTAVGQGGNIHIQAGSLSLTNMSDLSASTFGQGNAGKVFLQADNFITIETGSTIFNNVERGAIGNSEGIDIRARSLSLSGAAQILANTYGQGNAGNIFVQADDFVSLVGDVDLSSPSVNTGISSRAESEGAGNSGNININAGSLSLTGSQITASTFGVGNAGKILVQADDSVNLNRSVIFSSVGSGASGNGGEININARNLSIKDGSQLLTIVRGVSDIYPIPGNGTAGDINIDVRDTVTISGEFVGERNVIPSAIASAVDTEATGKGGNINIKAGELVLTDIAVIRSALDLAAIGEAGDINIQVGSLFITNSSGIVASTFGQGNAGNVFVQAENSISLANYSGIFTAVEEGAIGNGGDINIGTTTLSLSDAAQISAQSQGTGRAGTIKINATGELNANNGEITTAATQSGGGDITIAASNIRLHGDSDIRTDLASSGGSGGNINLTADSIIAFDDSDILAFAAEGQGGNITLNTPVFFGSSYRPGNPETDYAILDGNDRVDVNASGAIASGNITTPDTTFIQNSLTELPENVIDTNTLVANSCITRSSDRSTGNFIITGNGGLPTRPGDTTASSYPTGSVRAVSGDRATDASRPWQIGDPIVEPQGAYRLPNGQLVLSRECS
ncbi:filamentous hemagglutinin N-terminal domain-containing protein [Gloeocapsa sp. BRSZ]